MSTEKVVVICGTAVLCVFIIMAGLVDLANAR